MNATRPTATDRRHGPARSPMAIAITGCLLALAATPAAFAAGQASQARVGDIVAAAFAPAPRTDGGDALRAALPASGFGFSSHWRPAPRAQQASGPATLAATPSTPADPDAWITEEFQADWGLEVINAHHAYARGLSGAGIRLGLLDSGAALDHPEFSGKQHRGITMAQLLADGSRCSDSSVLAGPDACFYSEGDQAQITGEYYDPILAEYFPNPANDHLWGNTFFSFESHGTHVAGTIAANRDGSGMHGVAFGADLSSARLFNDTLLHVDDYCYFLNQCDRYSTGADSTAFDHMYAQAIAHGVKAMNHSWGYTYEAYSPEIAELYHEALMANAGIAARLTSMAEASRSTGMIQVVAAGNTGAAIANPGADSPHASAPATLPSIFPDIEQYWVSVVNLNDQLTLSNRSMKCGVSAEWCIAAPGSLITSTVLDSTNESLSGSWYFDEAGNLRFDITSREGTPGYADYSGTSMAAPHVTGALGLLFERFPYLTGAQVRDVMLTTATDLGAPGVDEVYGWGLLDLEKAIEGYGQLRVDTEVVMDTTAGGRKVWEGDAWDDWTNDIGGPGHLTKSGAGWLRLSGDNGFGGATVKAGLLEFSGDNALAGDVTVQGGTLLVGGGLSGSDLTVSGGLAVIDGRIDGGNTRIEAGGTLGGSGILGDTWVAGTIAPGNSVGTLTVDGDYTQAAGARFVAELLPPDNADLLHVTGTAHLLGGTLVALGQPGTYRVGQQYRLLSADGGVDGSFSSIDSSGLSPFLALSLRQAANTIDVAVGRGAALASAADTANQRAAATAMDGLADDHAVFVRLTQLSAPQAQAAFDQLSGEAHASAQQVLLDGGRLVRDAAIARASNGHAPFTDQYGPDAASGAWVEIHRQGGHVGGDGNAARTRYDGNAALVGIDRQFDSGWRIGAFGGAGRTDFQIRERGSKGDADTRHAGIHAGQAWGGLGVRAGYSYSWNTMDVERNVVFPGSSQHLTSRYDANAWQAFAEVGYRFGGETWGLEPYLQYAHVELDADDFREHGGDAALHGQAGEARTDLFTAGVRLNADLAAGGQDDTWLSLRGNLGYRSAGGDQRRATQAALDGGQAFRVTSPAITDEAIVAEFGIAARTSDNSLLELGYSGALSDEAREHGVSARFSLRF